MRRLSYDDMAHLLFKFAAKEDIPRGTTDVPCVHCGDTLSGYYCEDRLYLIRCKKCGIAALVKASNPIEAAKKSLGIE